MKVHNLRIFVWVIGILFLVGWSNGNAQEKIRYLDTQKILDQLPQAQEIQKKLDEIRAGYEKEYSQLLEKYENLAKEIESQSLLLSPEKKAEKERELENLRMEIENYQREKLGPQGEFYRKNVDLTQPLYDKIEAAIKKISQENDYDMVFDAVQGVILDAKPEYDITDEVFEELNKGS